MKLELVALQGSYARLACTGEMTPTYDPDSPNPIEKLLGPGCYGYRALRNLEGASYINSAGVGWLVGCHKNFERAGGRLVLYAVPPTVDHVLKMLKMNRLLHITADESAA